MKKHSTIARERLARMIYKHFTPGEQFTRADAWRTIRGKPLTKPKPCAVALGELVDQGYLMEHSPPQRDGPGRPALPRYEVMVIPNGLPTDPVGAPSHYLGNNGIEAIDALRASASPEEFKSYCVLTARTYLWRCGQKGDPDEDLRKAQTYLSHALAD